MSDEEISAHDEDIDAFWGEEPDEDDFGDDGGRPIAEI
jgi:hypothetical protein